MVENVYNGGMAQFRKDALINGHYYHIFSRSISKFIVFNDQEEYDRFFQLINVYRFRDFNHKYSHFACLTPNNQAGIMNGFIERDDCLVEIVAYCFMPTHIHLILKQISDGGITKFMAKVLNGYSRYFNTKHKRVGPLWSGRFKSVEVSHDEQMLHLTRYIHLNPVSADLVTKPNDWLYSSYSEYLESTDNRKICKIGEIIDMSSMDYSKFVEDHKGYQHDLSVIKYITIDNYSG